MYETYRSIYRSIWLAVFLSVSHTHTHTHTQTHTQITYLSRCLAHAIYLSLFLSLYQIHTHTHIHIHTHIHTHSHLRQTPPILKRSSISINKTKDRGRVRLNKQTAGCISLLITYSEYQYSACASKHHTVLTAMTSATQISGTEGTPCISWEYCFIKSAQFLQILNTVLDLFWGLPDYSCVQIAVRSSTRILVRINTDRRTGRQADRQTDRQTDRQSGTLFLKEN